MNFPNTLAPDLNTRAGRMLAAGRVKVTVKKTDGEHITVLFKTFRDNRDRQFKANGKNWEPCVLEESTHVFVEVPNQGDWNDKVGTFYPRNGRWYDDRNADAERVNAAAVIAEWLNDPTFLPSGVESIEEQSECARCGLELTDPISIARGIGPVCLGKMTGSQHQVKVKEVVERQQEPTQGEQQWFDTVTTDEQEAVNTVHEATRSQILPAVEWAQVEGCSDAEIESMIANLSRILEKREFARREREQENAAYQSKMERDQAFLGR